MPGTVAQRLASSPPRGRTRRPVRIASTPASRSRRSTPPPRDRRKRAARTADRRSGPAAHVVHRSRAGLAARRRRRRGVASSLRHDLPVPSVSPMRAVVPSLPSGSSPVSVGDGSWLGWDGSDAVDRVARWWQPARPALDLPCSPTPSTRPPSPASRPPGRPSLGRGAGLTPYADDVVCGALVTLRATGHPAAPRLAARHRRRRPRAPHDGDRRPRCCGTPREAGASTRSPTTSRPSGPAVEDPTPPGDSVCSPSATRRARACSRACRPCSLA